MSERFIGTRQQFIAAAGLVSAGMFAPETALAQSASPSPTATPAPSPAARSFAERMKRFDPQLTDAQLDDIAQGVDAAFDAGKQLRKGHPLKNGDAPVPEFGVDA
jgi:hypothetical protein